MLVGLWPDTIPNTSTWLGSRGAARKRSSSTSDTRGAFTMHLQPERMSSLQMSFRSTSGQSEGEAAHLVGLRTSRAFPLQEEAHGQALSSPCLHMDKGLTAEESRLQAILAWPLPPTCSTASNRSPHLSGPWFPQVQNAMNK